MTGEIVIYSDITSVRKCCRGPSGEDLRHLSPNVRRYIDNVKSIKKLVQETGGDTEIILKIINS